MKFWSTRWRILVCSRGKDLRVLIRRKSNSWNIRTSYVANTCLTKTFHINKSMKKRGECIRTGLSYVPQRPCAFHPCYRHRQLLEITETNVNRKSSNGTSNSEQTPLPNILLTNTLSFCQFLWKAYFSSKYYVCVKFLAHPQSFASSLFL